MDSQARWRGWALALLVCATAAGARAAAAASPDAPTADRPLPKLPLPPLPTTEPTHFLPSEAFPVASEPEDVTREVLVARLSEAVPGFSEERARKEAATLFDLAPGRTTALVNPKTRAGAVVTFDGKRHRLLIVRTSALLLPLVPLDRLSAAVSLKGLEEQAAKQLAVKLAQRLAARGKCRALAVFENGNAVAVTVTASPLNLVFIEVEHQFLKKGAFTEDGYHVVVHGVESFTATGSKSSGGVTEVPLIAP